MRPLHLPPSPASPAFLLPNEVVPAGRKLFRKILIFLRALLSPELHATGSPLQTAVRLGGSAPQIPEAVAAQVLDNVSGISLANSWAAMRAAILVFVVLAGCDVVDPGGRDTHCDDGTVPACRIVPPTCEPDSILAHRDHCFVCVNPATCEPWGVPGCESDDDCDRLESCDRCGSSSCPTCADCVAACR